MIKSLRTASFGAALLACASIVAIAQTSPNLTYGQVPTAGQWNQYFAGKQDVLNQVGPGSLFANCGISNAIPSGCSWNTFASQAIGNTGNLFIYFDGTMWTTVGRGNGLGVTGVGLEPVSPVQTINAASHAFGSADLYTYTRRSNTGAAMTDTFPPAITSGLVNGTRIQLDNVDASASDTITAGAGTTINGSSTIAIGPGRSTEWVYDLGSTAWRPTANSIEGITVVGSLTPHGVVIGEGLNNVVTTPVMTAGQILVGQASADPAPKTMSGDAAITNAGAVTVGKINGNPLGTTTPTAGNVLLGSGTALVSTPVTGAFTLSGAGVATLGNGVAAANIGTLTGCLNGSSLPATSMAASGCFLAAIGTGSSPVSLQSYVAAEPVNAVLYGIMPGATGASNLARLQQSVADGVTKMQFGCASYHFNGALSINVAQPTEYAGCGEFGGTTFIQDNATSDLFDFGTGATFQTGFYLHDITITTNGTQTAGYAVATNNTFGLMLQRVKIIGYCNGVDTFNAQSPTFVDIYISIGCVTTGKGITARGTGTGLNMFMTRVSGIGSCTGTQPQAGLYVENYDGIFATDTQFNCTGIGIEFAPPAPTSGQFPNFSHFFGKSLSLDTNALAGMQIDASGGYVFGIYCVQCSFDSNRNSGVYVKNGSNLKGLRLQQPIIQNNATYGAFFEGSASDIQIESGDIAGNSTSASGSFAGVQFGSGTFTNVQIVGTKDGTSDNLPNTQPYAIGVSAGGGTTAFVNIQLVANDFTGNITGAVNANFGTSTFVGRKIANNLGLVTENGGVSSVGTGLGSVTVTHGLSLTPTMGDIAVTPNCNVTGANYWADTPTATTFTIHTNTAQGVSCPFGWQAAIH